MRMKKTILLMATMLLFALPQLLAQNKADDVLGIFLNQDGDAHVEIFKNNGKYYGKLVWLKFPVDDETGKPKLDKKNPDEALQSRPVWGLEILKDFVYDADSKEWNDGEIYDPKSGKTYSCYMVFEGAETLKIRGYIGFSFIGRTTLWTRVK